MKKAYSIWLLTLALAWGATLASLQAQTFEVIAPMDLEGAYNYAPAAFGPRFTGFTGQLVEAVDNDGASTACVPIANDLMGAVALIDRGVCPFVGKALAAQAAGAIGVVLCNNDQANPDNTFIPGGADGCQINIPTIALSYNDCQALRMATGVIVSYDPGTPQPGYVFESAIAITDGTYTIDSIPTNGNTFANATGELWYAYTAPATGLLNISSCGSNVPTRLIVTVHPLGCAADLNIVSFAVSGCTPVGAQLDLVVFEGVTYYFIWDNAGSSQGFDFSVNLSALPTVNATFNVDMNASLVSPDGVQMVYASPGASSLEDVIVVNLADADGDGIWSVTIPLTTLDTIGYAFVNGDVLAGGEIEMVPEDCGLDGGFGFNIRPLVVQSFTNFVLNPVCFGTCEDFCALDCTDPRVFIFDDFESYAAGQAPDAPYIIAWDNQSTLGTISDQFAFSGNNAHFLPGGAATDLVYLLGDQTTGHYLVSWRMFVGENNSAYYNLQKSQTPGQQWAFEVVFNGDGSGALFAGSANASSPRASFTYTENAWIEVRHIIDLDNNIIRLFIDEQFVSSWPYNWQPTVQNGILQLGGVNFYPAGPDFNFYIDDFYFARIPEAQEGLYCQTAIAIDPGVHSVAEHSCFGAGFNVRANGINGFRGAWFTYTPNEDGWISLSSCDGAADTRAWVFAGDCFDLVLVGINDDRCDQANGDPYASYREVVVNAGTTYYILWDNIWDDRGFDFELAFSTDDLTPGHFCQSAFEIAPGIHTVESYGDAAVAGPFIGVTSASTTPFLGSTWYAFTAPADGAVTITSCDSGDDTRVWVYTGSCDNFSSLTLVAANDDGCAASSLIEDFEVVAGTTYYIEWDDEWHQGPFEWELIFLEQLVTVTFQVDAQALALSGELHPEGMFIAGSFSGWENIAMTDDDGDNIWIVEIALTPAQAYEYKFKNGPDGWENIDESLGGPCTVGQFGNREVQVSDDDLELDVVCFGYCVTCNLVAVDEAALRSAIKVFPNPARERLNVLIDLPEAPNGLSIRLYNAMGQLIEQRYLGQLQTGNIELDVRHLPAGAYWLQLMDGSAQHSQAVVIK
jgi:hypothetical protein